MLHASFSYIGTNVAESVIVADSAEFKKVSSYAKELLGKTFLIDDCTDSPPPRSDPVVCLEFRGRSLAALPFWVRALPDIKYLRMPIHLAESISVDVLPVQLETLEFSGEGRVRLPSVFVHKGVNRIVATDAVVEFDPSSFPSIKHFHAMLDKRKEMLNKLCVIKNQLITLTISPFLSPHDLLSLSSDSIKYIRLVTGTEKSLDGIENFSNLTDIHLHDLPKLGDIQALTRLQKLSELSIGYCNKISNVEEVLNLKALRKLIFYGCGKLPLIKYAQAFNGMKLDELRLG